ncbi:F-box-like domain-containing protein [Candidatus Protochlamydia phocaeensis]|uniref:F-box-like domain-containing protein n=1 Tax=Candidatus Protochlamydia phocaeensis TaxID=1414722 RepID=UPI0008386A1D|nr:F-box-like domain-containing protein [Candidatus Protochlamydia phocaeensis]
MHPYNHEICRRFLVYPYLLSQPEEGPINSLPPEMIAYILSILGKSHSYTSGLEPYNLVCKNWYEIVKDTFLARENVFPKIEQLAQAIPASAFKPQGYFRKILWAIFDGDLTADLLGRYAISCKASYQETWEAVQQRMEELFPFLDDKVEELHQLLQAPNSATFIDSLRQFILATKRPDVTHPLTINPAHPFMEAMRKEFQLDRKETLEQAYLILLACAYQKKYGDADPEKEGKGFTPLHLISGLSKLFGKENYQDLLEGMILLGFPIHQLGPDGFSPLHIAAILSTNKYAVQILMAYGANPYEKTNDQKTPLDLATEYDNTIASNYFINYLPVTTKEIEKLTKKIYKEHDKGELAYLYAEMVESYTQELHAENDSLRRKVLELESAEPQKKAVQTNASRRFPKKRAASSVEKGEAQNQPATITPSNKKTASGLLKKYKALKQNSSRKVPDQGTDQQNKRNPDLFSRKFRSWQG